MREEILFALTSPLRYLEVYQKGAKGRGVLLYGPPGTGKTLVAKVSYLYSIDLFQFILPDTLSTNII